MPPVTGNETRASTGAVQATTNIAFEKCIALLCSADVVATVTYADGVTVANVPLQKGWNPIQATKVVFATGTVHPHYN